MDVSSCKDCKAALKKALLKGDDPAKLKMKDGHLIGCPSLSPQPKEGTDAVRRPQTGPPPSRNPDAQGWPWAEGQYHIAPPQRAPEQPAQGWVDGSGRNRDVPAHREPTGGHHRGTPPPSRPARGGSDRRAEPRGRARVPDSGYAQAAARQNPQVKLVDHANRGEQRDQRKGVWLVVIVLLAMLTAPIFPPLLLVYAGAIAMLFLLR